MCGPAAARRRDVPGPRQLERGQEVPISCRFAARPKAGLDGPSLREVLESVVVKYEYIAILDGTLFASFRPLSANVSRTR